MKHKLCYMGMLLGMVPSFGNAFIYQVDVLKKWDAGRNRYHYVIGCGDFHDKAHQATQVQQKKIDALLTQCDANNTKVILEDLSCRGSYGRVSCGPFRINSRGGILGGLTDKCQRLGLPVDNIEYRYCRVVSLSPLLKNLQSNPHTFNSTRMTKVSALLNEVHGIMHEVHGYNDGPVLNQQYKKGLHEVKEHINKLRFLNNAHNSIAQYLENKTTPANRLGIIKWLLTFDSGLLDLKLAHTVINSLDKEKILIFAGGSHIVRTTQLLQKVGYKKVYSSSVSFNREYDLRRCLGSHITRGKFCVKPQPIDLDIVKKFL